MSPRTGRPKSKNPKTINLNIRLTKDEAEMIQDCADKLKITRTKVIVKGVKKIRSELNQNEK